LEFSQKFNLGKRKLKTLMIWDNSATAMDNINMLNNDMKFVIQIFSFGDKIMEYQFRYEKTGL